MLIAWLLVAIIVAVAFSKLDKNKGDYGNRSMFDIKTYPIASQKLQQQCLIKKSNQ